MAYDILIKGGLVVDGSGTPPALGDVGIKDDTIAAVGELGNANAALSIHANGKYVTPGFVDITNHSDTHLTLFQYPTLESLLMQGITTVVGGNCGASLAPLGTKEAINAIRKWADPSQINVNWANMEEYLDEVERLRPAVNYGTFVGYGTLRRGVIGEPARPFEFEEIDRIKLLLTESMVQGAYGLSLGLAYGHERVSNTEEILEVVRALGGRGILKIHLRSEGRELIASINEAVQIGRESGVSVQISHLKAVGRSAWPSFNHALELIQNASQSGLDITFDISPYSTTGSPLYLLIPPSARGGGFTELFQKIDAPEERKKIIGQLDAYSIQYDRIKIIAAKISSIVGQTLQEIAEHSGLTPAEALVETVRANEGRVSTVGRMVSPRNTALGVAHGQSFIASDGPGLSQETARTGNLVHPRSFGAFPHFWHKYVEDAKLMRPEVAVRKMTSAPAEKLRIYRRGRIEKGYFADITVFDPRLFRDRATYENPFRYSAGIEWVIVNGKVTVEEGRALGVRAGKVLRRG